MTTGDKWKRIQEIVGAKVDGVPGDDTATHILKVLDPGIAVPADNVTAHFTKKELACKCCGKLEDMAEICAKAEKIREHFGGRPFIVTSGTRCEKRNSECGGVANSRHLTGRAIDGTIPGVSADEVVSYAYTIGCRYAYHIAGTKCFHIDI